MDIETRKNLNKFKHYLTTFNYAYFDRDHMWIICETVGKSKLHWINTNTQGIDYLSWI